jgi:hypothetical protein
MVRQSRASSPVTFTQVRQSNPEISRNSNAFIAEPELIDAGSFSGSQQDPLANRRRILNQ